MVERNLAKVEVASSSLVFRSPKNLPLMVVEWGRQADTPPPAVQMTSPKSTDKKKTSMPAADVPVEEIRMAALALTELATSLHELVSYLNQNPQMRELPAAIRELSKRISVLSTRL